MQVKFVLDYRSPYAYLANTQVKTLRAQIDYQAVDILAVMKQVNNQPSPMCPPKAKYAGLDATRWAKHYGVPFAVNWTLLQGLQEGPLKGDLLSRAAIAAQQLGVFEKANDALFSAVWAGSQDLVSKEGRSQFLVRHALPAKLWDVAESPEVDQQLAASGERAVECGVFGVPTFFVDGEMFFGNDRLDFIRARLEAATNEPAKQRQAG